MTSIAETALPIRKKAYFSDDRKHRFDLWRIWDDTLPPFIVIGLNPSTADEKQDDPTIKRCISFAKREGCGSLLMLNLFSYRATNPKDLKGVDYMELTRDSYNNTWVRMEVKRQWNRFGSKIKVVCAWGDQGKLSEGQGRCFRILLGDYSLQCLGHTAKGFPRHPLYLPANARLEAWLP